MSEKQVNHFCLAVAVISAMLAFLAGGLGLGFAFIGPSEIWSMFFAIATWTATLSVICLLLSIGGNK